MNRALVFMMVLFGLCDKLYAHGVEHVVIKGGIGVKVSYSDGSPMSFGEVKVFSPRNREREFQIGSTDENGCFLFLPDSPGKWRIEISDGMGHGLVKEIEVGEDITVVSNSVCPHLSTWQKLLIGLSVIFGMTGLIFYVMARRELRKRYAHS